MLPYRIVKHRGRYSLAHGKPRVRVALGTDDLGVAEARAKSYWTAMSAPKSDKTVDLWGLYIADREAENIRALRDMHRAWAHLEPVFGYKIGDQITKEDCRAYIKARRRAGAADSTIHGEMAYLRACLNLRYGRGQGRTHIQMPPMSPPRDRHLTKDEVHALLEAVEAPHVKLFIILAVTTGARMGAILEAKWDQVDFNTETINYNPAGRVKTNKRRTTVRLNSRALLALKAAEAVAESDYVIEFRGEPIKTIRRGIRLAALRAKVPCSPHVFRHTAGVWMAQADIPMQKISQYLGHSTTAVTEKVYARYSPSFMKDAADALDW